MDKAPVWKFPAVIDICLVSLYMSVFDRLAHNERMVFDMNDIEDIHSSFIGFLVFCKERLGKNGGHLDLELSPYLQHTLTFLGMGEYFSV
ncbi:MAG: STAS domain-containing protein [Spirochaetes bacterium]|nr:STAS domain-containing protein [Spirochaetota bacterium]